MLCCVVLCCDVGVLALAPVCSVRRGTRGCALLVAQVRVHKMCKLIHACHEGKHRGLPQPQGGNGLHDTLLLRLHLLRALHAATVRVRSGQQRQRCGVYDIQSGHPMLIGRPELRQPRQARPGRSCGVLLELRSALDAADSSTALGQPRAELLCLHGRQI